MFTDRWTESKCGASERPKTFYTYYVTGSGLFPFDMLRYDACWPATSEDAAVMDRDRWTQFGKEKIRSIKMHSWREPTIARWQSFLWSVGNQKL